MKSDLVINALQDSGLRVTASRRVLAEVVARRPRHFTAAQILGELRQEGHEVSRATVFRTLDTLAALGILDRVHESPGCHAYLLCAEPDHHHHHLICSSCDLVVEVEQCDLGDEMARLAATTGFEVQGHRLEYFGLCARCQRQKGTGK